MPDASQSTPRAASLGELCAPTFLFLAAFRQQTANGDVEMNEALSALHAAWRQEELAAQGAPDLWPLYQKARYPLVVCVDEIIRISGWAAAPDWPLQESEEFGTTVGGERFFELMEDPEYRHLELREIFFLCLSIGFQGQHMGDRATLRDMRRSLRMGLEDVPRDREEQLVPEAYAHTQGEDFTSMPVASTARLVLVLLGIVLTLLVLARVSYSKSIQKLVTAAENIVSGPAAGGR
ncbi:MAG: DotU family type IV/VI secretion system protein [Planctomycetota bacterium]